jgi:hypothetical protein
LASRSQCHSLAAAAAAAAAHPTAHAMPVLIFHVTVTVLLTCLE